MIWHGALDLFGGEPCPTYLVYTRRANTVTRNKKGEGVSNQGECLPLRSVMVLG